MGGRRRKGCPLERRWWRQHPRHTECWARWLSCRVQGGVLRMWRTCRLGSRSASLGFFGDLWFACLPLMKMKRKTRKFDVKKNMEGEAFARWNRKFRARKCAVCVCLIICCRYFYSKMVNRIRFCLVMWFIILLFYMENCVIYWVLEWKLHAIWKFSCGVDEILSNTRDLVLWKIKLRIDSFEDCADLM